VWIFVPAAKEDADGLSPVKDDDMGGGINAAAKPGRVRIPSPYTKREAVILMDDGKLAERLNSGDPEAFINIMEVYNKLLWVVVGGVLNNVGSCEDIEECISDVYVTLWKNPKAYDAHKGSLKTFLAVMAKRKALDRYRQLTRAKIVELDEAVASSDDDLLEFIARKDLYNELYEAIRSLGEPDKEILIRRYFFNEKPSGIAGKTDIPVKEVENRLYQSKLRLRKLLGGKEAIGYES